MSHSDSEEKLQEIKEFLAKTWKIIVAVIVIGLLAIWGWRYWRAHNNEKIATASYQYDQLTTQLANDDPKSIDELVQFADQNSTIYSVFADLKAAQFYVENKQEYAVAEQLLIAASKKTDSAPLLAIINLRIARLQYQLGKYTASLQTLDKVTNSNWITLVNSIRGDVLVKMAQYQQACAAYEVALASQPAPELAKQLKIKLNQANYLAAKQAQQQPNQTKEQVKETTDTSIQPPKQH